MGAASTRQLSKICCSQSLPTQGFWSSENFGTMRDILIFSRASLPTETIVTKKRGTDYLLNRDGFLASVQIVGEYPELARNHTPALN